MYTLQVHINGGQKNKKDTAFICSSNNFFFFRRKSTILSGFQQTENGDPKALLRSKGFKFLLDASDLSMKFKDGKLVIHTSGKKAGIFGIRFPAGRHLKNIGSAKIVWGVHKFPQGADWAEGNNRLAIGALFSLGTKKLSSGLPFGIKDSPPFLGPFIGQKERLGGRYLGALYKEGGRYYCVARKKGDCVTTHFNIDEKFQKEFKKETPALSAFAFQMNTKDTSGGAEAFIQSITFYSK